MNTTTNSSDFSATLPGILIGGGVYVEVNAAGWTARRKRVEEIADGRCFTYRTVGIDVLAEGPQTNPQAACSAAQFEVGRIERLERGQ